jgi:hypothetical protein
LFLLLVAVTAFGQMDAFRQSNGEIWVNDKASCGFLVNGWTRYDFDSNGRPLRRIEFATMGRDTYTLRRTELADGREQVVYTKTWIARMFYAYTSWFMVILFVAFFSRVFVNSAIINRENGTRMSPIYAHIGPVVTKNYGHSLSSTFTFWWAVDRLKPENRCAARLANALSVIALALFFGSIIAMAAAGELK